MSNVSKELAIAEEFHHEGVARAYVDLWNVGVTPEILEDKRFSMCRCRSRLGREVLLHSIGHARRSIASEKHFTCLTVTYLMAKM